MVKNQLNKWTVIMLIFSMMFSSFSFASAAESAKSDVKGHWAESQLNAWLEKGLIKGYADGTVKPDNPVTRVELISLINRAFGFTEKADVIFSDIQSNNWAYGDVAIAIKAEYIKGSSDGTFAPVNKTSRQEVAVIIARLLKLQADDQNTMTFSDADRFASWSQAAIGAVAAKKIMQGYGDQSFKPEAQITRAEAVVTLDRALQAFQSQSETQKNAYNAAGIYGPVSGAETVSGDVVVNVSGVTLQNRVINGNLLLAAGIGNGDAFLKNVTVKGTTTVQGGGEHSIHFENSMFNKVIVDKKEGTMRLAVEGTTIIEELHIKSPVILELSKDSKIGTLIIDALLKVLGQGTIEKAIIGLEGKDSTFEKLPLKLEGPGAPTPMSGNGTTTITSVTSSAVITDVEVNNGTTLLAVLSGLPKTMQITLSDGSTPTVNVTWNGGTPAYNGFKGGTYAFTGTLTMPSGVSNPSNVQAKVNVMVAKGLPQAVSAIIVTDVVSSFSDIQFPIGTSLLSVLSGLPTNMQIKLSDGTNPTVNAGWDGGTTAYDGSKEGTYVFSGSPVISSDVSNPSNIQGKINVIVTKILPGPVSTTVVTNVGSSISDIQVPNHTSLLSVLSGLQKTVQITLSDGTTPTVNITWNGGTPAYEGYKGGTYAFTGTLAIPSGVSNPSNVQAKVNVMVAKGLPQAVSATIVTDVGSSFSDIQFPNGTSLLSVLSGLPTTMQIKLSDGTNPTVNVGWDGGTPAYDGNKEGTYVFSGLPVTSSDVSNSKNIQAKVNVIVTKILPGPVSTTIVTNVGSSISDIQVSNSTSLLSVLSGLPTTIQITLSDGTTPTVNVTWNGGTPAYSGFKGGTYIFAGTLAMPSGVSNPSNVQAKVNVMVAKGLPQQVSATIVTDVISSFSSIQFPIGTSLLSVLSGLPTTMQIKLSDGTSPFVNIIWDGGSPAYDGTKAGSYVFSGSPVISSAVSNPSNVQAKINVIIAPLP